jgi:hypothetical protein
MSIDTISGFAMGCCCLHPRGQTAQSSAETGDDGFTGGVVRYARHHAGHGLRLIRLCQLLSFVHAK